MRASAADYFRGCAEEGAGRLGWDEKIAICTFRVLPADVERFPELANLYEVSILTPKSRQ